MGAFGAADDQAPGAGVVPCRCDVGPSGLKRQYWKGFIEMAGEVPIEVPVEEPSRETGKKEPILNKYFKVVIKMKVSDLHLKADRPAIIRMRGDLRPLTGGPLSEEYIRNGIFELLSEDQKQLYRAHGAVDFAHDVGPPGDADRFRVNAFEQRGKMSVAARRVDRSNFERKS